MTEASTLPRAGGARLFSDGPPPYGPLSGAEARQSLRSYLFAQRLMTKYCEPLRIAALDFLKYFGARFSSAETGRLAGEKHYRRSGGAARRSAGQTRLNLSLSLNVSQHTFASHPILAHLSSLRGGAGSVKEPVGERRLVTSARAERPPLVPQRAVPARHELREILTIHESAAREVFSRLKLETVREKETARGLHATLAPLSRRAAQSQPGISLTRRLETLMLARAGQKPAAHLTQPANAPGPYSLTRVYLSAQSSASILSKMGPRAAALSGRAVYQSETGTRARLGQVFSGSLREGRWGRSSSAGQFRAHDGASLYAGNASEFIDRVLSAGALLYGNTWAETAGVKSPAARLLALRPAMTQQPYLAREAKMLKGGAGEELRRERGEDLERVLIFSLRREARLELPPVARVYAPQPQRPAPEVGRAVRQVEEKEVMETVRREVKTQLKSYHAAANFTRADFTIITDHVYDALSRRLLVERERLGLNS